MSEIAINKVVIHELVKEQHRPIQDSNIRTSVLDPQNETVLKLVDGITKLYGSRNNSAHYGTFRTGSGRGNFPDNFERYSENATPTDNNFMSLTEVAMDALYSKAESSTPASGGYILFTDYSSFQNRFFLVAMIKQKEGIKLSANLEPEELVELDLNRLYQAARINIDKLVAYRAADEAGRQEISYLSFVSPSAGQTAAGYFVMALGCAAGAASARATNTLIIESGAFFRENENLRNSSKRFRNDLLAYLVRKEAAGESAKLSEIEALARPYIPAEEDGQADEIVNAFISHLNSDAHAVPVEFPVNRSTLRKHTHISYSSDNWDLKFERDALGITDAAQIYYDQEHNRIIIKDLPANMVARINEELASRQAE